MAYCEPYVYISTHASIDPVKTVFLFAPEEAARTREGVEAFARESGWVDEVEFDAAVLVAPIAPKGWMACESDLLMRLYQEYRRSFKAVGSEGIVGFDGNLWAWETLIYLVGYREGAAFAGAYMLSNPGFAAAGMLIDGAPQDMLALDDASQHWLVSHPRDYDLLNRDIPVSVWLVGSACSAGTRLREHVLAVGGMTVECNEMFDGNDTSVFQNEGNRGIQMRLTPGLSGANPAIARIGMRTFFNHIIRWKNGPDGTLALRKSKDEFATDGTYRHSEVTCDGVTYHYAVYLPKGAAASPDSARGLPLVISLHGRGEPTWIFSGKNGWEDLADETSAFAVLLPDSPGNVWSIERDGVALCNIVDDAVSAYGFDAERIYITGFSNGACFTCQMATTYPERFAAASPWNGPSAEAISSSGLGSYVYRPGFDAAGYQMPVWLCYGDADDKAAAPKTADIAMLCAANGCEPDSAMAWKTERYPASAGYVMGDRFATTAYADRLGRVLVGVTEVKNMPHGAIADEARAAWEFMRKFKRVGGAPCVEVM